MIKKKNLKRFKNIEDKIEEHLKAIEDQRKIKKLTLKMYLLNIN